MTITLTIDRFEEDKAILKTNDGTTIIWPKNRLPDNLLEGMVVEFSIAADAGAKQRQERLAKDILNEILDIN